MDDGHGSSRRRLDSWKDIAEYLARDVSTAMRWARTDGLPVHHIGGSRHRAVFAYVDEVDDWLANQTASNQPDRFTAPSGHQPDDDPAAALVGTRPRRAWLRWGLAAVLALAAGTWLGWAGRWAWPRHEVVTASLAGTTLLAFDAAGAEVWRYDLPGAGRIVEARGIDVADVDGDGHADVVASLSLVRQAGDGTGAVMMFDSTGRLRWTQTLDDRYTFGTAVFAPSWYPDDVLVFRAGGEARVAVAWHHHTWWPSVVSLSDGDGRILGRFVNAGWIHRLNLTPGSRYLLASGVSNAFGGAMLAVLDSARIDGASPHTGGALPPCSTCPEGVPHTYIVVPWSDLARPPDGSPVTVQVADSGVIYLRAAQQVLSDAGLPEIIVELSSSLEILRRDVSDTFGRVHRQMEEAGSLTHPVERCPWRVPPVHVWTPARGWRILPSGVPPGRPEL